MSRKPVHPPRPRPKCPSCGAVDVIRIEYGLPGPELVELAAKGRVALGGCVVTGDDPDWQCKTCGAEFRGERQGRRRPFGIDGIR